MQTKASYCIMCGNRRDGLPVVNDHVIEAIRLFKRKVTRNERGSRLVVCRACYPEYKKRRDKYTSRQVLYIGLGVMFMVLSLIIAPSVPTFLIALAVLLVMYVFSLLNYTPAIEVPRQTSRPKGYKNGQHE